MANIFKIPIMGATLTPDNSGSIFPAPLSTQLTLGTAIGAQMCFVMPDPAGGGDIGVYGSFVVPDNYVAGNDKLVIRGVIDGAAANSIHAGVQCVGVADSEDMNVALGTEAITSKSIASGYADEEEIEFEITIIQTLAVGDTVYFFFFLDDSPATPFTGNLLLTSLRFEYQDA